MAIQIRHSLAAFAACFGLVAAATLVSAAPLSSPAAKSAVALEASDVIRVGAYYERRKYKRRDDRERRWHDGEAVDPPYTRYRRHRGNIAVDAPYTRVRRSHHGVHVRAPYVDIFIPRW